jgi:psp operon transcriptional activator
MNRVRPESLSLIGEAPVFLAMLEHVSRAAPLPRPVLVVGERGTGKEMISSRLHFLSDRWEQPLVKVNCAALTETLLETELFGHEAGAFTGATRRHTGRFEQADGGTLVLDELGTIPLRMQEKILRVIEYGEFQRVGGADTLTTDVRVVGVTNEDLPALTRAGRFRADLLDRLAFDVIHVPPLRARIEDIDALAYHFAVNVSAELKRELFPGFTAEAAARLRSHRWPGNVRELKNAVERSVYRSEDPQAPIDTILFDPFDSPFPALDIMPLSGDQAVRSEPGADAAVTIAAPASASLPADFRASVADFERALLSRALESARYKQTTAADLLGLTYHQFRGLLKKYGISANERRDRNGQDVSDDAQ